MDPAPFTAVARVVRTHGVAGELSCTPLEGPLDELPPGLEFWFVPPPGAPFATTLEGVRPGPKGTIAKFAGVDSVERARELTSTMLLVNTDDVPAEWLEPDEGDVVGLAVFDVDRGNLGVVTDVIVTGANDVWVVRGEAFGEVLLPVIDDVILHIDEDGRTAKVRLLPGLIDED
jgi:16S rRNA processing protein RimM